MNKFPDLKNPIHFIATLGGIGKMPFAPGTWGSFFACILFIFISHYVSNIEILICSVAIFSIWICERASVNLVEKDHKSIVIDELAGMWIALYPAILYQTQDERVALVIIAFLLFRFFDILKPFPISYIDKNVKGGLGIVLDDVIAGIFAAITSMAVMFFLFV
jgi:phosphatidylglycerophosphatase A